MRPRAHTRPCNASNPRDDLSPSAGSETQRERQPGAVAVVLTESGSVLGCGLVSFDESGNVAESVEDCLDGCARNPHRLRNLLLRVARIR